MQYLVYLPGKKGQDPQLLRDVGLEDHIAGATFRNEAAGPDGTGGAVVFWDAQKSGFEPNAQDWLPAAPDGDSPAKRYWVGVWRDDKPMPEELKRADILSGWYVPLGDGQQWAIPAAEKLPKNMQLDGETGQVNEVVDDRYRRFWDESRRWYEAWRNSDGTSQALDSDMGWWGYLVYALRLNYRIVPELCSYLKLFTTENRIAVVAATIEAQQISEVADEKKTLEQADTGDT